MQYFKRRYCVHLATAFFFIIISPLVSFSVGNLPLILLLAFAITALINFTNFMDGLDGLVAVYGSRHYCTHPTSGPWTIWALIVLWGFALELEPREGFYG